MISKALRLLHKKDSPKVDLEDKFLHLWDADKDNVLEELGKFPLTFFTDRQLVVTDNAIPLEPNHSTYFSKTPIIYFKDRVFRVNLVYDFEGTIVSVTSVREVPLSQFI